MPAKNRYPPENYSGASEFRFYKLELYDVYTTDTDRRVRIDLPEED